MTDPDRRPKATEDDLVRLVSDVDGYLLDRIPAGIVGGVVEAYDTPVEGYAVDVTIRKPDGTRDFDNVILRPEQFDVLRHPCALNVDADLERADLVVILAEAVNGSAEGAIVTSDTAVIGIEGPWPRDAWMERETGSRTYRYDGWAEARAGAGQDAMTRTVTALLDALWSRGIPAVVLCDYREDLPDRGGLERWDKLRPGERGRPGDASLPDGTEGAT